MTTLRECPNQFCQTKDYLVVRSAKNAFNVECRGCGMSGPQVVIAGEMSIGEGINWAREQAAVLWNALLRGVPQDLKHQVVANLEEVCRLTEEFGVEIWERSLLERLRKFVS